MSGHGTGAANGAAPPRHFLDIADFSGSELRHVLDASAALKARRRRGELAAERPLLGKTLAMVFDKPSTRTRVSFDVAMPPPARGPPIHAHSPRGPPQA